MRLSRRAFGLGLFGSSALAPLAAAAQGKPASGDSQALTAFLDAQFEEELLMSPERLTALGRRERYGELQDRTEAAGDRALAWRRRSVAAMKARFDPAKLNEDARISYEIWALELVREEKEVAWRRHRYLFDRNGAHTGFPNFMINAHKVATPADMEAYIARVRRSGGVLDQLLERAKLAASQGIRMPRFAYDQSLTEVARVTAGAPFAASPDSPLFADAKAKIAALKTAGKIDAAEADALTASVATAMTGQMKPAYDRLAAWLTADRANTSAEAMGVGALPKGAAFYDATLFLETTTELTAPQIHDIGLKEVARVHAEMEILKTKVGFQGSLQDFFVFMRTDQRFYVPNTDDGRRQYLALAEHYLADMKTRLPRYFATLPKADLVVRRVESFREEPGGAAHYNSGAADGSRPGTFYVHLADTMATPTYELEGTAYHEGLPGHHMQISIAQELTGLPKFRTQYNYGAYAEGWGLYSESLAKEMGFYLDPYSDFGRLSRDVWRGIRLVVDTGLHSKGWSEAQALAYYTANSPQPAAKIRSEVKRYIVTPGQATSYKVGEIRIRALRDEARAALGAAFDYRAFHDVVLKGGSLPLPVLETRVRRWIVTQKQAA